VVMEEPRLSLAIRRMLLIVGSLAVVGCPPPRSEPVMEPGPNPDGSSRADGGGTNRGSDGPSPSNQACGSACEAAKSDGCCPTGCTAASDIDCSAQCGNEVIEMGEECDPPGSCPASCPNRGCTRFTLQGEAARCTALCREAGVETTCRSDDGCCPAGCSGNNDNDCLIMCGNGTREGSETCDPLASCPTACPAQGCQLRKLVNAGTCTAECVNERQQTTCMPGDGCCPPGCHGGNDADCMAACDNGIKESGETCEPVADCMRRQTACKSDQNTTREGRGNPATCTFECLESARRCGDADGQCPAGCADDPDCKRANGAECESAGQCLSNRCTDGRCCTETCGACEKCTASGGRCELPANTKICGSTCVSTSTCCTNGQPGACPACSTCVSGSCMLTGRDCGGGRCVGLGECCATCPGPCKTCNAAGTACDNTSSSCNASGSPGTCRSGSCVANCPEGNNCGSNGICQDGTCRECTGNLDVRCNGQCAECCNNNNGQCSNGEVCQGNQCNPPPCGQNEGDACCAGDRCGRENLLCLGDGGGNPPDDGGNRKCTACGGRNQPCCLRDRQRFGTLARRCLGSENLVCPQAESFDLCTPCGADNQPCCMDGGTPRCDSGLSCLGSTIGTGPSDNFDYDLPGFCTLPQQ
jgi:hypothetical protein